MWRVTAATELFGVELPIFLAPLGGGPGTPELAAAVSGAGGLGWLGLGYAAPEAVRAAVRRVRELTDRPFGVNLFVPDDVRPDGDAIDAAVGLIAPFRRELGLPDAPVVERYAEDFAAQVDAVVAERVPVVGFTFGVPDTGTLRRVKEAGAVTVGTATTVAEAEALAAAGLDALCAQGAEAGGHRGSFLGDGAGELVGLAALVPAVADTVRVPVIASGGVMDGRGVVAALALGASAVALGTAFMRCPEAGTNPPYRAALAEGTAAATVVTRAFSGRPARGLRNRFVEAVPEGTALPQYPVMHALTRELRARAAAAGRSDMQSLWAGQGVALSRELPAGELVARLVAEADAVVASLAGS